MCVCALPNWWAFMTQGMDTKWVVKAAPIQSCQQFSAASPSQLVHLYQLVF